MIPSEMVDKRAEELGIDFSDMPISLCIDVDSVCAIRDSLNDNAEPNGTVLYMQSGESFWTSLPMQELIERIQILVYERGLK